MIHRCGPDLSTSWLWLPTVSHGMSSSLPSCVAHKPSRSSASSLLELLMCPRPPACDSGDQRSPTHPHLSSSAPQPGGGPTQHTGRLVFGRDSPTPKPFARNLISLALSHLGGEACMGLSLMAEFPQPWPWVGSGSPYLPPFVTIHHSRGPLPDELHQARGEPSANLLITRSASCCCPAGLRALTLGRGESVTLSWGLGAQNSGRIHSRGRA